MAINDIWRLSIKGTVLGQEHVTTSHFRNVGTADPDAIVGQAIINAWQASARTAYRALFRNEDTPVDLLTARKVCGATPLPAPVEETEVSPNRAGSRGTAADAVCAPSVISSVCTLRTGIAGKRYRGRFFVGGILEADIDDLVQLDAAYVAALQAYGTALVSVGSPTYSLFVFSRTLAALGGQCQNFGADVTAAVARTRFTTMRSRLPGHGN